MSHRKHPIDCIRLDIPLLTSWAYLYVYPPPMFDWDPWWGRLFEYLSSLASEAMDWHLEPVQVKWVAFMELTDEKREEVVRFLKSAPASEQEGHRTLKRAVRLTAEQSRRLRLVFFSDGFDELRRQLQETGDASGYVSGFQSTHHELCVTLLSPEGNRARLYLEDCVYICGSTEWKSTIDIAKARTEHGYEVTVTTGGGEFKAIAGHAWLALEPLLTPPNFAAATRALRDMLAALPSPTEGAPTPAIVVDVLQGLSTITALLSEEGNDRTEEVIAQFVDLADKHPELRPAADAALAMRIRFLP